MSVKMQIATNLARNIKQLREARGLTQEQISKLSKLPRPTWANLESGTANPTLAVLLRVSSALQVSLEELVGSPRGFGQLIKADEVRTLRRGDVLIRKILSEGSAGAEFDRMELPAFARMSGVPHRSGTREYLMCEIGKIELSVAGEKYELSTGDVLIFRGDQRHSYYNPERRNAVGYSVVFLAPAAFI